MGRRDIYCLRGNQKTFKWSPENGDNIKFWRYIKHYRRENIFCWWFLINQDNINIIGLKIISLTVKGKSINTVPQVSGHLWPKRTQRHQHQGKQSQRQQQGRPTHPTPLPSFVRRTDSHVLDLKHKLRPNPLFHFKKQGIRHDLSRATDSLRGGRKRGSR